MTPYDSLRTRINELLPDRRRVPESLPLPVKYDGMVYLWGKDDEMVADVHMQEFFRIRGWGRLSKLASPEEKQDECARYIAEAINAYAEISIEDVLRALPEAYSLSSRGELFCLDFPNGEPSYSKANFPHGIFFDLSKPLSAPENEDACGAVLKLLK